MRDRRPNWRAVAVLATLVGAMLASAGGAWAVRDSWLDQQRAVEAALHEYAMFAARALAELTTAEGVLLRVRATASVTGRPAGSGPQALTLVDFAAAAGRVLDRDPEFAGDPWRGFFRAAPDGAGYAGLAAAADPRVAPRVVEAVRARRARLEREDRPVVSLAEVDGESLLISIALQRTAAGAPAAVYGYVGTRRRITGRIAERLAARTASLVPPSLLTTGYWYGEAGAETPAAATDGLIAVRVSDDQGRALYESPRQFASTASAEYVYRNLNTIRFRVTLHPVLVARVRGALLDRRREPLQFALAGLSLVLAGAVALYVRRERELAGARRDFVASVSHELRTPLAQIRMFSETLLLRREDNEAERMRWLGIIGREARRLGDLVENILLFSHIDAARVRLEPERTDLGELVEEAVEVYVPIAAARRMRIVADAPSRIYALVDPRALRQVVVNLLDNALKYGPPEQTVRVELEREGTSARLAVIDQGPGVPPADRRRLFDPFVRLTHAGGTSGGSGIGLSVVRSLVQQHGGSVWVDAAPGGGARFVVLLPLAVSGAHPALRPATGAQPAEQPAGSRA